MSDDSTITNPQAASATDATSESTDTKNTADTSAEGDLKDAGKRALAQERQARRDAEKRAADLESAAATLDALRKVLTPEGAQADAQADLAAQVADLIRERDETRAQRDRETLAASVAAEAGISAVGDVQLIAAQHTEDAMRALAARLKDAGKPSPKPDPSAGQSGDPKPRSLSEAIHDHYRA